MQNIIDKLMTFENITSVENKFINRQYDYFYITFSHCITVKAKIDMIALQEFKRPEVIIYAIAKIIVLRELNKM